MSISGAPNDATLGLAAAARLAETAADNVANATTPGNELRLSELSSTSWAALAELAAGSV